jgi:hypothetical protein
MGQILSHRRDLLFFVLQQHNDDKVDENHDDKTNDATCCSLDGDINVYSIPSVSQLLNAGTPNEMKDLSRHDWLPSFQIPGAKFDPNQFIPPDQQCVVDSDANMIPSNKGLVDDIVHVGSKKKYIKYNNSNTSQTFRSTRRW